MRAVDERDRDILRARARRLTQARAQHQRGEVKGATIVVVGVGAERFGVESRAMRGVVATPPITALPHLPQWMPGITQVRGEVMATISLARWFGVAQEGSGDAYLAILDCARGPLGLLVDRVIGFATPRLDALVADLGTSGQARPIRGVTDDLVALLDVDAVSAAASLGRESGDRHD